MERLIVERMVDGFAILEKEDMSHIQVSLNAIGVDIKEGSVLLFDGARYSADKASEDERRKRIFEMQERLKN